MDESGSCQVHMLSQIEKYLKASNTPPTRFGRVVARDPRLVHDMRNGREIGPRMTKRIVAFLAAQQ
jgi:hypothetical protein